MTNAYSLVRDYLLRERGLHLSYWSEFDPVPLSDWKQEVANNDTRLGYWEFVAIQLGIAEVH